MQIDKLTIKNFKNYSTLVVEFSPGINLLVGANGTGKTTILEAINVAAGGFFASRAPKYQRYIHPTEIKLIKGVRANAAYIEASSAVINGNWARQKNSDGKNDSSRLNKIKKYGAEIYEHFENPEDRNVAPIIAYYSTQRLFRDSKKSKEQTYDAANGRRNGYLQCLDETAIKEVLKSWLANAVTRRATLQIKEIQKKDQVLENVEVAIKKTLLQFIPQFNEADLKIFQDPDFDNDLFLQISEETILPLSYYSDGFRNLLYLIIDMMWRASQLNPWLDINGISENVTGVITIDEIDLHLHPTWQAKAIDLIRSFLPKVQFFISTHSPTVVANFKTGTLYIIDREEVNKYTGNFFGKEINSILRDILGAPDRNTEIQDKIDSVFKEIDEEKSPINIYRHLVVLKNLLGKDDAEIQRAISLIEWNKAKNDD